MAEALIIRNHSQTAGCQFPRHLRIDKWAANTIINFNAELLQKDYKLKINVS